MIQLHIARKPFRERELRRRGNERSVCSQQPRRRAPQAPKPVEPQARLVLSEVFSSRDVPAEIRIPNQTQERIHRPHTRLPKLILISSGVSTLRPILIVAAANETVEADSWSDEMKWNGDWQLLLLGFPDFQGDRVIEWL